jgi:hypothetical protein
LKRGDCAAASGWAVHDRRVEFDDAIFVGESAIADAVIFWVVFDDNDTFDDGVEGVTPLLDQFHGAGGGLHAVAAGDDDGLEGARIFQ